MELSKLLGRKKKTADEESPATTSTAAARGAYEIDEHQLQPREVAERYGVQIDWKNIQGSRGLTTEQVSMKWLMHASD
jgi:hypothetical protein